MAVNLDKVEEIVARHGAKAEMAIPILQEVQAEFRHIPAEAIERIAERTEMSESQLYGVATFYSQFRLEPSGKRVIKVCHGTACHVGGSEGLTEAIEQRLGIKIGQTTSDMEYTLTSVACVGCCSLAPVVMVEGDKTYGRLDRKKAVAVVDHLDR
ncbi:MAG: NADH-quinone oxidoreductase subunit NuoE [Deltaproteobacteria bacterium]|nr:NADH-quinone oxidoreductase subunit NuoE [Deltaproteobacteria bacterium]